MTDVIQAAAIKQQLAALAAGMEVGCQPDPQAAARIPQLAAQLEALNPTPAPVCARQLLRGHWKLLYSTVEMRRRTTLAKLSFNMLPDTPVHVAELFNQIDPATGLWDNVINFEDMDSGVAGTLVIAGHYFAEDESRLEVEFSAARVSTGLGRVVKPIDQGQWPPSRVRISYLDESFRLLRSARGNLYLFERLDPAPLEWARNI